MRNPKSHSVDEKSYTGYETQPQHSPHFIVTHYLENFMCYSNNDF